MTSSRKRLQGQGLLEYIALTALVAIVCIGTMKTLGSRVKFQVGRVTKSFDSAMKAGPAPSRGATDREEGDADERTPGTNAPSLPRFPWSR